MLNLIRRSPRNYTALVILITVVVVVYMWQARTTVEYGGSIYAHLCHHAHLGVHKYSSPPYYDFEGKRIESSSAGYQYTPEDYFTFIRHYHTESRLARCVVGPLKYWGTSEKTVIFDVHENKPWDDWPERPGMYAFVRHTEERKYPIYFALTNNLLETLKNPSEHEASSCLNQYGPPTHIHARLNDIGTTIDELDENDLAFLLDTLNPPCNSLE